MSNSQLLLLLDRADKHGLLDPSPGGGTVPIRRECPGCGWVHTEQVQHHLGMQVRVFQRCEKCEERLSKPPTALLLRTADGTVDSVGMARAGEVLARVEGLDPAHGTSLVRMIGGIPGGGWWWELRAGFRGHLYEAGKHPCLAPFDRDEHLPEVLAALLAERAGFEVIRG